MNREEIIRMAREAGKVRPGVEYMPLEVFERFAKLVAAAERERWYEIHTCHPHCDRPACVAVRRAREDEREACAVVCDKLGDEYADANPADCAFVIRERGAP